MMAAATQESHSNRQQQEENSSSSAGDNAMQSLRDAYNKYGAFGTDQFHGNNLTLTNADKWLREAGLFTAADSAGKKQQQQQQQQQISTADTGIVYKQIVGNEGHAMSFEQFCEFLRQLAGRSAGGDGARHGTDVYNDFCAKLAQHAQPQLHDTTRPVTDDANSAGNSNSNKTEKGADGAAPAASDAVIEKEVTERLTDPSGFTGVQKEHFNEDGSGKGIAETSADYADRNVKANDGYVQGYKDKDTYDEKH